MFNFSAFDYVSATSDDLWIVTIFDACPRQVFFERGSFGTGLDEHNADAEATHFMIQ